MRNLDFYIQDTNLKGQERRKYIVLLLKKQLQIKDSKVYKGTICLFVFIFSLNNNSFKYDSAHWYGSLFCFIKNRHRYPADIYTWDPCCRAKEPQRQNQDFLRWVSYIQPGFQQKLAFYLLPFTGRVTFCCGTKKSFPLCAQSPTALAFLYHCSFLSLNAIFFLFT